MKGGALFRPLAGSRRDEPPFREEEGAGEGRTNNHGSSGQNGRGTKTTRAREQLAACALLTSARLRAPTQQHIQSMEKRAEFLQKKIDKEIQNARDCSKRKDKRAALMALKRKNLYVKVRAPGRCLLARPLAASSWPRGR